MRRLQDPAARRRSGNTLLEGPNLIDAALNAGVVLESICVAVGGEDGPALGSVPPERVVRVTPSVLRAVAATESPRGPVAVIEIPPSEALVASDTVVLWDVADPGNSGTLIRTAAAFGWNVAVSGGVDPWNPKVLRAGAGGHFVTRLSQLGEDPLTELRDAGLSPVALVASGGSPLDGTLSAPVADDRRPTPMALLVGNEAHGLPVGIAAACDAAWSLPMRTGVESLNASVAGGIAMWALRHRR
jgi:TrmH family RNA methyltransferase